MRATSYASLTVVLISSFLNLSFASSITELQPAIQVQNENVTLGFAVEVMPESISNDYATKEELLDSIDNQDIYIMNAISDAFGNLFVSLKSYDPVVCSPTNPATSSVMGYNGSIHALLYVQCIAEETNASTVLASNISNPALADSLSGAIVGPMMDSMKNSSSIEYCFQIVANPESSSSCITVLTGFATFGWSDQNYQLAANVLDPRMQYCKSQAPVCQ